MARTLMDMGSDFRLEDEHDAYRAALEQVVAARLSGIEPPHAPAPAAEGPVDLMAALEESVRAAQQKRRGRSHREKGAGTPRPGQRRRDPADL